MPNIKKLNPLRFRSFALTVLACLLLTACATSLPDPALLIPADDAIGLAEDAGARTHAPLELDEALALRQRAEALLDEGETEAAVRHVEQAVLQARLAGVRTRGALARQTLAEQRATLDMLEEDLREAFGDAIDLETPP